MLRKIIAFTLSILLLLTTSFSAFFVGDNLKAYGFGEDITRSMANFLFPIASYIATEQLIANGAYDTLQVSAQDMADIIDDMNSVKSDLIGNIPVVAKILFTKIQTDLSDYEINKMYGTTFSKNEMLQFDTQALSIKTKITNNEPLTNSDLYGLGIHSILSNYLKSKYNNYSSVLKTDLSGLVLQTINGIQYVTFTNGTLFARSQLPYYDNSDFIQKINGKYSYTCINGTLSRGSYTSFLANLNFYLELSSLYYLTIVSKDFTYRGNSDYNYVDLTYLNTSVGSSGFYFYVKKKSDNSTVTYFEANAGLHIDVKYVLDKLKDYMTFDILTSGYYINSTNYDWIKLFGLDRLGKISYVPKTVYTGQNSIDGLLSRVIEPVNVPDTSLGQAEKIIANVDGSITYDNNIIAIPNDSTGDNDIGIIPSDTSIPSTSSSDTNVDVNPDTGAVTGDGVFNIPILGTMLKALWDILNLLKSFLEALKNLFISLFVPSTTFLQNYFSRVSTFLGDRLGLLYYPIELLIDFINRYMNIPDTGSIVIDVPALVITSLGKQYTLFPAYRFDFNSVFGMSAFSNIRAVYLVAVDVIVIFGLVYLLQKKFREVFHL